MTEMDTRLGERTVVDPLLKNLHDISGRVPGERTGRWVGTGAPAEAARVMETMLRERPL